MAAPLHWTMLSGRLRRSSASWTPGQSEHKVGSKSTIRNVLILQSTIQFGFRIKLYLLTAMVLLDDCI